MTTQEQINAIVARLSQKADTEHAEVLGAIADLKAQIASGQPVDLSGLEALEAKIGGIFSAEVPTGDKHNVALTARTTGGKEESMTLSLINNGVTPERAEEVKGLFGIVKAAVEAQPPKGAPFASVIALDDNGARETITLDNSAQKNAADVAVLTAALAVAQAALDRDNAPASE